MIMRRGARIARVAPTRLQCQLQDRLIRMRIWKAWIRSKYRIAFNLLVTSPHMLASPIPTWREFPTLVVLRGAFLSCHNRQIQSCQSHNRDHYLYLLSNGPLSGWRRTTGAL